MACVRMYDNMVVKLCCSYITRRGLYLSLQVSGYTGGSSPRSSPAPAVEAGSSPA